MLNIIQNDINNINLDLSKLQNKSVLITGASGLVGIYLLAYIKSKQKEFNIRIYAWTKTPPLDIFEPLFKNCTLITGDITNTNIIVYEEFQFDYIIHAAGYGQPNKFLSDKIKTIELNTLSTILLFKHLKQDGTFLFISTSELYSGLENYHITEKEIGITNPNHPRACYIEGKRCGEAICHAYIEQGYNVKIARLSLAYGPGTKPGDSRVMNSLIERAIKNDAITLMDGGQAIRTYCYITDVVEMMFNILLFGKEITYNVGGISTISILELANMIGNVFNKPVITPNIENELKGNPKIVNISTEKYVSEFNKNTFISFETGLKNTIEWHKNLYK